MNDAPDHSHSPKRPRRIVRWLWLGSACLFAAWAARYAIFYGSSPPDVIPAPPRPGLNAPFITTADPVIDRMVQLAELSEDDLVYDLGCGDGRIVLAAASRSGCRGVGFDIDPARIEEARANAVQLGVEDRVQFLEKDIFTIDLRQADVAVMYLLPWMVNKLVPQFREMKPGSRIVSHEFWIDGAEVDAVEQVQYGDGRETRSIFVYGLPLRFNPSLEKGKAPMANPASGFEF